MDATRLHERSQLRSTVRSINTRASLLNNHMNYVDMNIHGRINAKGNAMLLYYSDKNTSRPKDESYKALLQRVVWRNALIFSPAMLLDKNTKTI